MDEEKKKAAQLRGIKAANSVLNTLSNATHYRSYHAYQRSMRWLGRYLGLIICFACLTVISPVAKKMPGLVTIVILMMLSYLLVYYWIMAKSKSLKADSHQAMLMMAMNGVELERWYIYDGIFDAPDQESLELVFFTERSFIVNVWYLIRHKKQTLPIASADLADLKKYVEGLSRVSREDYRYVAYATITDEMIHSLSTEGIQVTEIPAKYRTRPGRWDYAVAVGDWTAALWNYPRSFKAVVLSSKN